VPLRGKLSRALDALSVSRRVQFVTENPTLVLQFSGDISLHP